ncbi:MAG: (Fe-S)-binding protein [Candidatus Acidiferrales bacterium]
MATQTKPMRGFSGEDKPQWDDYARCVHCGLCLNHCPTYRLWGLEADSPRGRIRQMALVDEGRLELGAEFVKHIDQCLDCRACETACPSGVEYGKLVEAARAQIERHYPRPPHARLLRWLVFQQLLPHPRRIAGVARMMRFYQRSGLARLARSTGLLKLLGLAQREQLMPAIDREFFFSRLGKTYPASSAATPGFASLRETKSGQARVPVLPRPRARVAFFGGCLAQVTFTALNDATIRVLQANGCEVVVPEGQVCCGALCAHAGVRDTARELARKNLDVFLRGEFDAIVTNAAGCGSTLKEYSHLFASDAAGTNEEKHQHRDHRLSAADAFRAGRDGEITEMAARFAAKVRDVTEFLEDLGLTAPLKPVPLRVTYQDSCHLLHGQQVKDAPRQLIRAVPGVELIEMPLADYCCGSAGVYNVTQTKASLAILEDKMRHAASTNAQAIVTANPGCILQLRAGAAMHSTGQEVLHVIELLDRASAVSR